MCSDATTKIRHIILDFDMVSEIITFENKGRFGKEKHQPYVKYEVQKDFTNTIATRQILIPNAGHNNSENRYDTFEDVVSSL